MKHLPLFNYIAAQPDGDSTRREQLIETMLGAMETALTRRQYMALRLYYFEGLTMRQIADCWGMNRSAVSRHIGRACRKLSKTVIVPWS